MATASSDAAPRAAGIAAILFDYGGTLDGDAQHWFDHFLALYARLGLGIDRARIHDAFYRAEAALAGEPAVASYGLDAMVRRHVRLPLPAPDLDDDRTARRLADAFIADTRGA